MTEHSYRLVPWTISALLLATAPHVFRLPVHISIIIGCILLWRLFLHRRFLRMPPNWIKVTFAIAILGVVLITFRTINGVDAGSALLIGMVALKTLELNKLRDHASLLLAAFFIIISYVLYETSIWSSLYLLPATSICVLALIKLSAPNLALNSILAKGKKFLLYGLPLTALLFVLFPRIQGPLWGLPNIKGQAKTGLSDSMSPGSITDLVRSDELAFRAKFNTQPPDRKNFYWRGPVLSNFDGNTWSTGRAWVTSYYTDFNQRNTGQESERYEYEIFMEPTDQNWLYILEFPLQLPERTGIMSDLVTRQQRTVGQIKKYKAVSSGREYFPAQRQSQRREIARALRLPEGTAPQTKSLADSLVLEYPNQRDLVNAVLSKFNQELFSYTLSPQALDMSSPVDDFLFRTKEGFCEHYASAFTVLMRHSGIPARVVTGYLGGEKNSFSNYYVIKQSDAHAWAEIYLEDQWIRVDPTAAIAPERVEQSLSSLMPEENLDGLFGNFSVLLNLESAWIAINTQYLEWIVGFDKEKQNNFMRSLGFDNPDWRTLIWLLVSGIVLATVFMSLMFWRQAKRIATDPLRKIYDKFQKRLYKRGLSTKSGEGPQGFANRASMKFADRKNEIQAFVEKYIELRYYVKEYDPAQTHKLKKLLKSV